MSCSLLRVGRLLGGDSLGVRRVAVEAGFLGRSTLNHFFGERAGVSPSRCERSAC